MPTDYERQVLDEHGVPHTPTSFFMPVHRKPVEALDFTRMLRDCLEISLPVLWHDRLSFLQGGIFRVTTFLTGTLVHLDPYDPVNVFRSSGRPMALLWIPNQGKCGIL